MKADINKKRETQNSTESTEDAAVITATSETTTSPSPGARAEVGWVVRVGVFSESSNLEKRSSLLAANGMTPQEENININVLSTSEIKLSVLIERKYLELEVRSLHDAFDLQNL